MLMTDRMQIKEVYIPAPCNLSPEDSLVGVLPGAVSAAELLESVAVVVSWGINPTPAEPVVVAVDVALVRVVDEPSGIVVVVVPVGVVLLLLPEVALAANPVFS